MKHIFTSIFMLTLSWSLNAQTMGEITVQVDGVTSSQGDLVFTVAHNNDEFKVRTADKIFTKISAHAPSTTAVLRLPVGECAINVFHDENGNGKIDKNMLGIPKEMYGISNNKYSRIGAQPPFKEAVVAVTTEPKTIYIKLRKF